MSCFPTRGITSKITLKIPRKKYKQFIESSVIFMMKIIQPRKELRPYVRYYWILENDKPFRILTFPIGCPQIIFHKKSPLFIPELNTTQCNFTISGQVNFPSHIQTDGNLEMIVAVFYPHTIGMFIDTPPSSFYNLEISGHDLKNPDINRLSDQIFECENTNKCITIIENWLLSRINPSVNLRRIQLSIMSLLKEPGQTVNSLADLTCLSKRQFERIFYDMVGMPPKEYARIVRFQKALWFIQQNKNNYAGIAIDCGFSDQSHFIREFKALSGYTPHKIRQYCDPYSDLFTNPV